MNKSGNITRSTREQRLSCSVMHGMAISEYKLCLARLNECLSGGEPDLYPKCVAARLDRVEADSLLAGYVLAQHFHGVAVLALLRAGD